MAPSPAVVASAAASTIRARSNGLPEVFMFLVRFACATEFSGGIGMRGQRKPHPHRGLDLQVRRESEARGEASNQRKSSGCGSTIGPGSTWVPPRLVPNLGGRGVRCRAIVAFARSVVRLLRRLVSTARAVVTAAVRRVRIPRPVIAVRQLKPHRFPTTLWGAWRGLARRHAPAAAGLVIRRHQLLGIFATTSSRNTLSPLREWRIPAIVHPGSRTFMGT
jgi:hypothetical protein